MFQGQGGTQLCTTAAGQVIGVAGRPTRIYSIEIISGATAGIVNLYNGIATVTANLFVKETCTAVSTGNKFEYGPYGILFPNGCWYVEAVDADVVSTTVSFTQEA